MQGMTLYLDLPLNLPVPYKYLEPSSQASQYFRYTMIDPWFQIYRELQDEGSIDMNKNPGFGLEWRIGRW